MRPKPTKYATVIAKKRPKYAIKKRKKIYIIILDILIFYKRQKNKC